MNRRRETSFKRQMLTLVLCITIPLSAMLIVNSLYSIQTFNEKIADSNQRTVEFFIDRINRELDAVDETLTAVMAGDSDFMTLSGGTGQLQAHLSSLALYTQLKAVFPSYTSLGAFFIYSAPSHVERDMFTSDFAYAEKEEIRQFVRGCVESDSISYRMGWKWQSVAGETFLFRFFGGRGTYLAAMIPLSHLLNDTGWEPGQEAVAVFTDLEGTPLTQQEFIEEKRISLDIRDSAYFLSGSPKKYMVIGRSIPNADCRLVVLVGGAGYLDSLSPVQLLLLVLSLFTVLLVPLILFLMNRSVFRPLEEVRGTMERIRAGDLQAQAPTQGQVREFRQVNETFNTMMGQIRGLKIEAYEREIETQKAELRYLQLQIRPHFFLNCLKSIYALAQQKQIDNLQRMILAFSRHIRYIFGDNMELVPLGRELEHVRNYMEIQRISAVRQPVCRIDADPRLLELPVPPLSVQTFVENSIKHEMEQEDRLEIDVKASLLQSGPDTYVDLVVSDNGSGFPEEVLREINDPESPVYAQHHVGLNNVKKRLNLIYGEQVMLAFFNSGHGSVSEILIPVSGEPGEHLAPRLEEQAEHTKGEEERDEGTGGGRPAGGG